MTCTVGRDMSFFKLQIALNIAHKRESLKLGLQGLHLTGIRINFCALHIEAYIFHQNSKLDLTDMEAKKEGESGIYFTFTVTLGRRPSV